MDITKKVYLKDKKCLAMFGKKANEDYWNRHWQIENLRNYITSFEYDDFIIKPLKKYLPYEKGIILEGGCGRAQNIYCMIKNGYNAIGVDFAEKTVKQVKEAIPEIDVRVCDVRNLPFKDGEIAGYWSIGVIEHFWDKWKKILDEMARVIRGNKGFLFISFPYMSPLRKLKVFLRLYEEEYTKENIKSFYQYCFNYAQVVRELEERGFTLREKTSFNGIKGFKDEINLFRPFLQRIYNGEIGSNKISRKIVNYINKILELFSSHCILLIMEKI